MTTDRKHESFACKCGASTYEEHLKRPGPGHTFRLRNLKAFIRG